MKILMIRRLNREIEEEQAAQEAETTLRGLEADGVELLVDSEIDWGMLRALHGGYNGAYNSIAQDYDRVVVIEGYDAAKETYFVARGQFSIIQACLEAGTLVSAWRGTGGIQVVGLEQLSTDWKGSFGRCVLRGEEASLSSAQDPENGFIRFVIDGLAARGPE